MTDGDRLLIERFVDGDIPDEECSALLARLESDTEAIAYLVDTSILISDLRQSLKHRKLLQQVSNAIPGVVPAISSISTSKSRLGSKRTWFLAAALFLGLFAVSVAWLLSAKNLGSTVDVVDLRQPTPSNLWQRGNNIRMQDLVLDSGSVDLRLEKGVIVRLEGPLRGQLVSGNYLRLTNGSATATVGSAGIGFVIETPQARIVDQGTSFGVSVDTSNQTDVVVYEGKVDVFGKSGTQYKKDSTAWTLTEGEAARFDNSNNVQRLRMLRLGTDKEPEISVNKSIVVNVTDNTSIDTNRFYGLVPGGMNQDVRLYTTGHTRKWHPSTDAPFPSELIGADIICTNSDSRRNKDLQISISVSEACDVYVMPDGREPAPSWIQRDFVETPLKLRSGPWIPRGTPLESLSPNELNKAYVPHTVWKKRIEAPGIVVLGPATSANGVAVKAMYGIAVKRLGLNQE